MSMGNADAASGRVAICPRHYRTKGELASKVLWLWDHSVFVCPTSSGYRSGYSSLSYLLSFPLDRIKIDRSFTMGLGIQERASVLVEGVSAMSRRLGMSVLIEGVETAKQLRMVEALGTIAEAQGYLFSRPVSQSAVSGLLRRDFRVQAA